MVLFLPFSLLHFPFYPMKFIICLVFHTCHVNTFLCVLSRSFFLSLRVRSRSQRRASLNLHFVLSPTLLRSSSLGFASFVASPFFSSRVVTSAMWTSLGSGTVLACNRILGCRLIYEPSWISYIMIMTYTRETVTTCLCRIPSSILLPISIGTLILILFWWVMGEFSRV